MTVAVLFARRDSIYKTLPGCDVYDIDRDARTFAGGSPVVAHPPCRAWGGFRHLAKPRPGEKELALFAIEMVRWCGGVLEHPAASSLWKVASLPDPGERDIFGGWTLPVDQWWFGHRCRKRTLLYIVGCEPTNVPPYHIVLGDSTHVIARAHRNGVRQHKGDPGWRPEISRAERERTPPLFAHFLLEIAERARQGVAERVATVAIVRGEGPRASA